MEKIIFYLHKISQTQRAIMYCKFWACMFLKHFKNCSHLFFEKSLITSIWFRKDKGKKSVKWKNISIFFFCAHIIGLNFLSKNIFTSCIVEATISLRHKCFHLRKSIRIQGFCWQYIEFFIISIQYHFIHVQKKMTAKLKQLF